MCVLCCVAGTAMCECDIKKDVDIPGCDIVKAYPVDDPDGEGVYFTKLKASSIGECCTLCEDFTGNPTKDPLFETGKTGDIEVRM